MKKTLSLPISNPAALGQAAALLRAGELVAFPTDTVYGVGAIFSNAAAVDRIYAAKGRPDSKGIPILLASLQDLFLVVREISEGAARLADTFWPGPLTLVLPKNSAVPSAVTQTATVAVRVPDHPLARALIAASGAPLAVTSANRSGEHASTDPAVVRRTLGSRIAAVLDGGITPGGVPSTIVDCTVSPPDILRSGPIPAATIFEPFDDHRD